jgi:sigma-B regulation protein RsbU (phosphoserine phosphatase)
MGLFRDVTYREGQVQLEPGDVLLLYTDGIPEAANSDGELFGEERLRHALRDRKEDSAAAILNRIHETIRAFTADAPRSDDMTMVLVKVK